MHGFFFFFEKNELIDYESLISHTELCSGFDLQSTKRVLRGPRPGLAFSFSPCLTRLACSLKPCYAASVVCVRRLVCHVYNIDDSQLSVGRFRALLVDYHRSGMVDL